MSDRKNIIIIEDSSKMGGVQYSTFYFAEEIIKQRLHKLKILIPFDGAFTSLCKENNIPYNTYDPIPYISTSISLINDKIRIPNPFSLIYNISLILINSVKTRALINSRKPDIVITKGFFTHMSGGLACKMLKIPIIWHLQDLVSNRYFGLYESFLNFLANKIPNCIICDGQLIKAALKGDIRKRSFVVLNGIKSGELQRCPDARRHTRKELGISENAYVIGHVARIKPWKGQIHLLKAFIDYSKHNLDSYLILAGSPLFGKDKYYNYLKNIIHKSNLHDRVIMPGYRSDLKNIFSAMDMFIYPSVEKDTSPLVLLSAISAGLPIAMTQIESLEDIASHCPSIDLFNIADRDYLIKLIKKYENPILRNEKGLKNKKYAYKYFDISIHTENIARILTTI